MEILNVTLSSVIVVWKRKFWTKKFDRSKMCRNIEGVVLNEVRLYLGRSRHSSPAPTINVLIHSTCGLPLELAWVRGTHKFDANKWSFDLVSIGNSTNQPTNNRECLLETLLNTNTTKPFRCNSWHRDHQFRPIKNTSEIPHHSRNPIEPNLYS